MFVVIIHYFDALKFFHAKKLNELRFVQITPVVIFHGVYCKNHSLLEIK